MQSWTKWFVRTTGFAMSSILSVALAEPAFAGSEDPEPAPACVTMHESWRYTDAANDCASTVGVRVVYRDGATGLCYSLPPGVTRTVGEGYLGQHGHPDHLAACEVS
ncbi:Alpha-amylase inhibitor Paim-2 [Streptomyces cyanogenus]|uniref:Alpha-amylase inhibitor Paim-2 n=2 Tax=Streptomyces cyanogenus TaxID=80860 RepID=A0ABX7TJM7_STRCY|nr:Alpha-amylase inhibitor Paim-2 [Streptomyces cyanogenus]